MACSGVVVGTWAELEAAQMALASAAVVGDLSGTGVPEPPCGTMVVAGVDAGEGTVVADPAAGRLAETRRMPDGPGRRMAAFVVGDVGRVVEVVGWLAAAA